MKYLFTLLMLVSPILLLGQKNLDPDKHLGQYNYDHWDSYDGLPDNAVIHIMQSKDGYIWFASYGGITRFNGAEFKTYSAFNTPGIVNNSFTYIYEDSRGVIWAATSGNGLVSIKNSYLDFYTQEDGLPSNFIEEMVEDKSGRLWVATSDGLIYKDPDKPDFEDQDVPKLLGNLRLKSIDVDDKNSIWIGTTDQGVYEMRDGQILNYYHKGNAIPSNNINYLKSEASGIWIGHDEGLTIIKDGKVNNIKVDDGLPNNMVSTFIEDKNGMMWVGTFSGLARADSSLNWSYFPKNHPLYQNDFTSLMQDKEGNLWIGTYRQGMYKLWDGKFTNYSNRQEILKPYIVHCLVERDEESLLVVSENDLDILWTKENRFTSFPIEHDYSDTKLKYGLIDSKGATWVATQDYLVKYYNGNKKIYNTENGLVHNAVRVLYEDAEQNIWVGTTNGITVIHPDGTLENHSVEEGLSHEYIMSISGDSKGNIWIGTRNGLNIYKDNHFVTFYRKDGLAGEFVFKTFEDSDGVMWVCGNAGLTRFKDGKFKVITNMEGLASNTIFQIMEDDKGFFWITTNQKNITTFKVHKSQLNDLADGKINRVNSIVYTQADGLKSTSATSSSRSIKTYDGKLWFSTSNGIEMIDPDAIDINRNEPPVRIESFTSNSKEYVLDSAIEVPPGRQRITITYAALSFIASDRIRYRYKLEGYDEDWIEPETSRKTTYTNLPYGEYTFKVKAANSDGIWNDEGAEIRFKILPSFYETPLFIVSAIVVGMLLIWGIYKIRVRALENSKLELAKKVEERTQEVVSQKEEIEKQKHEIEVQQFEIELKNKELQKININLEDIVQQRTEQLKKAYDELVEVNKELDTFVYRSVHDVRGPLARLQGLSHLISLETSDEKIHELVRKLNNTADEMNDVFYSLLNIARLKSHELILSKIDMKKLSHRVMRNFDDKEYQIDFQLDCDDDFELYTDPEILELIIFNLVENAIKFRKSDKVTLKVLCRQLENHKVSITIMDDGIGIDENVADKIFEMFYVGQEGVEGSGLGLYTVTTAVKVIKGEISLLENARTGGFTAFQLLLPERVDVSNQEVLLN